MSDPEAIARWLAALALVFVVGLPLATALFSGDPGVGGWFALPVGLLSVVGPPWFVAGIGLPYATATLTGWAVTLAVAGWMLAARTPGRIRRIARHGALPVAALAVLFVAAVVLRGFTPDLTGTEKPMDAAFLSSAMRATTMPPPDPWLSGHSINYYYLGYVLWGSIGRIGGIPPSIAFNLAIPTIFAAAACAAAGAAIVATEGRLGRPGNAAAAVLSAALVMIGGNLLAPVRLLADPAATLGAWWWGAEGIGWRASRIVCDGPRDAQGACAWPSVETINEFPIFSVLLGDLHPHLMALPFMLLAVGGALLLLQRPVPGAARAAAFGTCAGALYAVNSWDFPTALALMLLAVGLAARPAWRTAATTAAWLIAGAVAPWLPFWLRFDPPTSGGSGLGPLGTVSVHVGERTGLLEFLMVFGIPAAVGATTILLSLHRTAADGDRATVPTWATAALGVLAVAGVAMRAPVLFVAGSLAVLGFVAVAKARAVPPLDAATLLAASGFGLTALVEVLFLRDVFGNRMNTLFKVYYQVWVLLGVATAITAGIALDRARAPRSRWALGVAATAALAAMLAYPAVSSWQWIRDWPWSDGRVRWRGLDGLAYADERYPDEAAAIRWLAANAGPGDVLLEAAGCSYQPIGDLPFSRFSAYTGIPTVVGWANHERQWRAGQPDLLTEIAPRQEAVAAAFADPGPDRGIDWMIAGRYETGEWHDLCEVAGPYAGLDAEGWPGAEWTVAFRQGNTAIYRRTD